MKVAIKRDAQRKKGRPAVINTVHGQHLAVHNCPAELKLQLITEADEMELSLSMYVAMVLQGVGREVRKAAAMELAIELEQKNDATMAYKVTPNQISAFEAELLAGRDKDDAEEKRERLMAEQERIETERLLSEISGSLD